MTSRATRLARLPLSVLLALAAACGPPEAGIPGGPGTPALQLTSVPAYGSHDALLGQVWHVDPSTHRVAVYIWVAGTWWVKPTYASPLTSIEADGSWGCDVTTGGIDALATRIAAFLVPADYRPPLLGGASELPPELAAEALAQVQVTR